MISIQLHIVPQPQPVGLEKSYLLVYDFGGKKIAYYPSSIDVIKADLAIEIEECESRRNHEVCI